MISIPRLLATALCLAALALILLRPAWSPLQLVGHGLLGLSLVVLLGGAPAFLAVTLGLALQGWDPGGESAFRSVFLTVWMMVAGGGLLVCLVLRRPSLGKQIELGPFGPGGV